MSVSIWTAMWNQLIRPVLKLRTNNSMFVFVPPKFFHKISSNEKSTVYKCLLGCPSERTTTRLLYHDWWNTGCNCGFRIIKASIFFLIEWTIDDPSIFLWSIERAIDQFLTLIKIEIVDHILLIERQVWVLYNLDGLFYDK